MDAAAAGRDEPGAHGHGHRVDASLLPLKKRALNYDSTGPPGRTFAGDGDPYSSSSASKKTKRVSVSVSGTTTADTRAPAVPHPRRPSPAPTAAASREPPAAAELPAASTAASPPPEAAAEGTTLSDKEKKWLSKGKWAATTTTTTEQDQSRLKCPCPPPVKKKLMHDGIRSSCSSFAPHHSPVPPSSELYAGLGLGEPLERRLASLRATRPWLVLRKTLRKSDVDENQNRLLISCKRGLSGSGNGGPYDSPLAACFSALEMEARVVEKDVGVYVTALDAGGEATYAMTCKFLGSNSGYRLIAEWKEFLKRHGMNLGAQRHRVWARDVDVEVWAFRSRSAELPFQPRLDATGKKVLMETLVDGNGKRVLVPLRIDHHLHPDGAPGFILLLHENRNRRNVVKKEEEDDDDDDWEGPSSSSSPVARKRKKGKQQQRTGKGSGTSAGKQLSGKRDASASASAAPAPVALPAPVAEQGEAARLHWLMFYAAIGLTKLQQAIAERWQQHVDGGGQGANKGNGCPSKKEEKKK